MTIDSQQITAAVGRLEAHILKTPLLRSSYLSAMNDGEVYLKLENEQHTGSFKARGALNKILASSPEEKENGFVTASTGNHAQGFARGVQIGKTTGTIYLPENASKSKIEALKQYDLALVFEGNSPLDAELKAKEVAEKSGKIYVSPYNDTDVIAGQGTIAKEITEDLNDPDVIFGCIGGGGMMSGIGSWFKEKMPQTEVIGCLPENSPEMYLSMKKGKVVHLDEYVETLSDGSAGGLEDDAITFEICKSVIDQYLLVAEEEIAKGIRWMIEKHHKIIEGAAAVSLMAFMLNTKQFKGQKVVIIICGGNIAYEKLVGVLRD